MPSSKSPMLLNKQMTSSRRPSSEAGHIVHEQLFYALEGSIGGGTAKVIADGVVWVMWALL